MERIKESLKTILLFFLGGVLSYASRKFATTDPVLVVCSIVTGIILALTYMIPKYKAWKYVRFAVVIFLLNDKDELLLVKHPSHDRLLPPCRIMNNREMPHEAVERVVKEFTGLKKGEYEIDDRFHKKPAKIAARIHDYSVPYAAQQEHVTKHYHKIRNHYSFVYVYKIKPGTEIDSTTEFFPEFYNVNEINEIEEKLKPFQDIVVRYKAVKEECEKKKTTP